MSAARPAALAFAAAVSACATQVPAPVPAAPAPARATAPAAPIDAKRSLVSPTLATLDDLDARFEYATGERVRIGLAADRTTGRRWRVAKLEGGAIAPYGAPVFTAANIRDLRTPGNWIFEFEAKSPGTAHVTFDFRRENEPAGAAERTATFEVRVR